MSKPIFKVIKNELRSEKRVLPEQKPKALNPPVFKVELIDFHNHGLKWYTSLFRIL